jgi:hypothetical protein
LGPEALKSLPHDTRQEIFSIFPDIEVQSHSPIPARPIPAGRRQKHLIRRHKLNAREVLVAVKHS